MFKSPADKRAKSLERITRNAAIYCAVFDEENPLGVLAIYEVPVEVMLREAERQLDASRNEISHVGFTIKWAADEYREAIRLKPDYSAAHRGLGRALERAGQIAEARVAYQQGLEVATRAGDLQTGKEIEVFLRRLEKAAG